MTKHVIVLIGAVWLICIYASPISALQSIRNYTPAAWQADDVRWSRDTNPHNGIDDLIDVSKSQLFDIVVNFKRCVEDSDIDELARISPTSTVQMRLKYISSVAIGGLTKADISTILETMPDVAFVEGQWGFSAALDVSTQNIKVAAGFYSPNTVEDQFSTIDGTGINIVILDSGVDNVVHGAFTPGQYVAGYDAMTQTFTDPDDDLGHGTHVASIALGHATANTSHGVAPGAGLIDVKVLDQNTFCSTPGQWQRIVDGLQTTYDNRDTWGVDVINISLRQCDASGNTVPSDGTDAFSQLVDLAESMGIVVVIAAGNDGPNNIGLSGTAASTRAITVAAANDNDDPDRTQTTIAFFSSRGERDDDGDLDVIDELKPEVTAPGYGIRGAMYDTPDGMAELSGTSMAAPHVAGLAALIMQAKPGINAASVKDLIISTAEQRGPASSPGKDPEWNREWGWGLVDAYSALSQVTAADVRFPSYPPTPGWLSPDIIEPYPLKVGVPTIVTAVIENAGPNFATDVRIHFGVHEFSAPTPGFHDIGTVITDIPVGTKYISVPWTPTSPYHQCLKVEIGYGPDTDFSNNNAQRNITVAQSPATFKVYNPTLEFAQIHFLTSLEYPDTNWSIEVTPPNVMLYPDDCPVDVEVLVTPLPGPHPDSVQIAHIAAMIGDMELGGVSVKVHPPIYPAVRIEKTHETLQGHFTQANIVVIWPTGLLMGGFDFLIAYDAAALAFTEAQPGDLLDTCDWEYFTYRFGANGNCGDACPSGLLRLIALAETNNGPNHPSCFGPPDTDPHELATMTFYVTNDRTSDCQFAPIYFFWGDCADNSVSNATGDSLFIDHAIYDFEDNLIWDETDEVQFPEDARIPFVGAPDYCLNPDPDKPSAIRFIDFVNGGIDIICSDSIDVRGDINVNGVGNEIADAVMFTNYFINGLSAFGGHVEASIAASDVNADGVALSVADLVYLIRVITGDAQPYPKMTPNAHEATANLLVNHSAAALAVNSPVDIGAGYFVFEHQGYSIGEPQLINGASGMTLKYSDQDGILRVLVYSMEKNVKVSAGAQNVFVIPIEGQGTVTLTEIQLSDYYGNLLTTKVGDEIILPKAFALHQNYPNPFNATTTITYELPAATHVKIEVINVLGQRVAVIFDADETPGVHVAQWNGADASGTSVASGVYVYRLTAGNFSAEKKMVLMK